MARMIYIPQYPSSLRYSEWHFNEFEKEFKKHFDEVVVLGKSYIEKMNEPFSIKYGHHFSPVNYSITFEQIQIEEYLNLKLRDDDILYLNDISFPGLFASVLYHKKPKYCYAYCHGTSQNNYDYFSNNRKSKWNVETGHSQLFDIVFLATNYHAEKLGWDNTLIVALPKAPDKYIANQFPLKRDTLILSTNRPTIQKYTKKIEDRVEKKYGKIKRIQCSSWGDYSLELSSSIMMLSTTKEETFGYTILDAITCGCIPLAPNNLCFPELLPREYLYDDYNELTHKIDLIMNREIECPKQLLNNDDIVNFYNHICGSMKNSSESYGHR